jgi:hypothetical protein
MSSDHVRVSTFVAVPIEDAFAVFTEEMNAWWRRGPAFRLLRRRCARWRCGGAD